MTNEDSPFRSPSLESTQPVSDEHARLLRIVWYQRVMMFAILAYIGLTILPFLLHVLGLPLVVAAIPFWCIVVISAFVAFRLALQVSSPLIAIFCGLLMLIPIGGLGVLVVVNHRAVRVLQVHGLEPGFLGMSRAEAAKRLRADKS